MQRVRDFEAKRDSYSRHEVSANVSAKSQVPSREHPRSNGGDGGSLSSTPRILSFSHKGECTQGRVHDKGTSGTCAYREQHGNSRLGPGL